MNTDPLVSLMRRFNVPIRRESYVGLAFMGDEPTPEQEAELPFELIGGER